MIRRRLGPDGPEVSAVGLGTWPLTGDDRPDADHAVRVIRAALDAGMDWIDTADVYCRDDAELGYGERLVARALADAGRAALVATKGGCGRPGGDWTSRGRPDQIRAACHASLRNLGVERIDLYQLHAPDDEVPFADTVGELAQLRAEGTIRHVGLSNVSAAQLAEARAIVPIASVQNRCNPLDRSAFHDGVLDACAAAGIAFIAYSPVGGAEEHRQLAAHPALGRVAARLRSTPYEVALAWLLARSPVMLVIPGATREASARSSARAGDLRLSPADLAELDRAFPT